MTEYTPKIIDKDRFQTTFGNSNQHEIFEAIANHVRHTGDVVETIELGTGSERFQATVTFYTEDQ